MVVDAGVAVVKHLGRLGQKPHGLGLGAAQVDVPCGNLPLVAEFRLGVLGQGNQLLRPFVQHLAGVRQGGFPLAPDQKRRAQFLLQVGHLPGQGGLGNVQQLCRMGNILFFGHHQKVMKNPQLHTINSFVPFIVAQWWSKKLTNLENEI